MPEAWAIKMECINGVEPHSHLLLLRGVLIQWCATPVALLI